MTRNSRPGASGANGFRLRRRRLSPPEALATVCQLSKDNIMAYKATYRTKSGRYYFRFSYERQSDGEVRIYIVDQPSYRGRATGGHPTHRFDVDSRPYICFVPPPTNLDDAIKVSKAWAERTDRYIETGERF